MAGDARERPIIFSASEVRATLDGRKTQTRRIAKITAIMGNRASVGPHEELIELDDGEFSRGVMHYSSTNALSGPYPIGLRDDADAVENAICNPGTIRVENMITGEIVWERTVQ